MKKSAFIFIISVLISLLSCKSTQIKGDTYDSEEAVPIKIEGTQRKTSKPNIDEIDPYNEDKIRGDRKFFEQLLNAEKYEKITNSSLYVKSVIGSMSDRKITLIYKPGTDMAGFLVRYDTSLYTFYMAKQDRALFINAVEKYFSDFENKTLERKGKRKTEMAYGNATCFQEFGIVEAMMNDYAKPKATLGYSFSNGSPFFVLTVKSAKNLNKDRSQDEISQTIEQKYYFTKEQAKTFADFMSDENVLSLANRHNENLPDSKLDKY